MKTKFSDYVTKGNNNTITRALTEDEMSMSIQNYVQNILKENLSLETRLVRMILVAMALGVIDLVEFILLLRYWI